MFRFVSGLILSLSLALSVLACSESTVINGSESTAKEDKPTGSEAVALTLSEAISLYNAAKEKNHAWIVTSTEIALAEQAIASGDLATAQQAAKRAHLTAQASLDQARLESQAWRARVP
jgi:hypothetical protein